MHQANMNEYDDNGWYLLLSSWSPDQQQPHHHQRDLLQKSGPAFHASQRPPLKWNKLQMKLPTKANEDTDSDSPTPHSWQITQLIVTTASECEEGTHEHYLQPANLL